MNLKKTIIAATALFLICSCTQKTEQKNYDGIWVNLEYQKTLIETKSPLLAQRSNQIPFVEIKNNANDIMLVWNLHEGIAGEVKKESNKLILKALDNITYNISLKSDTLIINEEQLIKIDGDIDKGIDRYINNNTVVGTWKTPEGNIVTFNVDGSITGLNDYSSYYVNYDFFGGDMQINYIYLTNTQNREAFAWELNGDNLSLYKTVYSDQDPESSIQKGELYVVLTKKLQ